MRPASRRTAPATCLRVAPRARRIPISRVRSRTAARRVFTIPKAAISIITRTNATNNDVPTGPKLVIGKPVTWSYLVTNIGNATLTGVSVSDSRVGPICSIGTLAPSASQTCTKTGTVQAGQYVNVGTASGNDPSSQPVTATNPDHYYGVVVCDVNGDSKINSLDINLIFGARDLKVSVGDPRDLDGDRLITVNDARGCVLRCTKPNCAL